MAYLHLVLYEIQVFKIWVDFASIFKGHISNGVIALSIYVFLLEFSSNIWHKSALFELYALYKDVSRSSLQSQKQYTGRWHYGLPLMEDPRISHNSAGHLHFVEMYPT